MNPEIKATMVEETSVGDVKVAIILARSGCWEWRPGALATAVPPSMVAWVEAPTDDYQPENIARFRVPDAPAERKTFLTWAADQVEAGNVLVPWVRDPATCGVAMQLLRERYLSSAVLMGDAPPPDVLRTLADVALLARLGEFCKRAGDLPLAVGFALAMLGSGPEKKTA